MKKTSITISYDEEKLSALKLYLGQKNSSAENELTKALDMLYAKVHFHKIEVAQQLGDIQTARCRRRPECG